MGTLTSNILNQLHESEANNKPKTITESAKPAAPKVKKPQMKLAAQSKKYIVTSCPIHGPIANSGLKESVTSCPICHTTHLREAVVGVVSEGAIKDYSAKKKKNTRKLKEHADQKLVFKKRALKEESGLVVCPVCGHEGELSAFEKVEGTEDEIRCPSCGAEFLAPKEEPVSESGEEGNDPIENLLDPNTTSSDVVCDICNYTGTIEDFEQEDGTLVCPSCGAEAIPQVVSEEGETGDKADNLAANTYTDEEIEAFRTTLVSMDAPEEIFTKLDAGDIDGVVEWIAANS